MSTRYTIDVQNRRGANTTYAVFMEPPQFTGGLQSYLNVWYTSFIPFGGSFSVETGVDFYSWVGTVPTSPAPGVVVNSGMSLLTRLGTSTTPGSTFDQSIIQSFPTITEVSSTSIPGAYEIDTGSDFNVPNNTYLVGLAKVNHRGQIAPVASIAPLNNMKIQVTPKMKFFVSESQAIAGEIVDYSRIVRDGATIDFSSGDGLGKFYAVVTQGTDGKFEVKYYDNFDEE
ncbi:hypothetical protein PT974_09968 [Cladobotryum mycophilum]|uniref:Uncharacterized protein n=1 Tax=Cladobotryum mycophilum TaxID=491253 RepID=A0ABR0S9N0_9HYPO